MAEKKEYEYNAENVAKAQQQLADIMAQKPTAYQGQYQQQLADTMQRILNREQFSYDLNGDALYKQYKDQAIRNGRLAMMDTMGQAAALTGGYGNSYAQQVGQQTYNGYLAGLNERIPELYQLALERYNAEGDRLNNQYSLLNQADNRDYGRYQDALAAWQNDRSFYGNRYDTERNLGYQMGRDATADEQWERNFNQALAEWEESKRQWQAQQDFQREQWDWQKAQAAASRSSGGGGRGGSGGSSKTTSTSSGSNTTPINLQSVLNLGKGPISGNTLSNMVNNGSVQMVQSGGMLNAVPTGKTTPKAPSLNLSTSVYSRTPTNPTSLLTYNLKKKK